MQVVARDVLHRAGSALHEQPVASHQLELDHRVADVPEPQPPERRDAGRDHAADGRVGVRVHRPLLPALRQHRLEIADTHARVDDREHLRRLVRHDLVQHRGPELRVDVGRVPAIHVGTAPDHEEPGMRRRGLTHGVLHVLLRVRVDQIHEPSGRLAAASAASEPRIIAKSPHRAPAGNTFWGFIR